MKRFFVTTFVVGISCVHIARAETSKFALSESDRTAITQTVKNSLRDPDSASFKNIVAAVDDSGIVEICGLVNSKNGFGGYVGFEPFYAEMPVKGAINLYGIGGQGVPAADVRLQKKCGQINDANNPS